MIIKNKKKKISFLLILFSVGGLFFLVAPVHAAWAEEVVAGLIGTIISALGLVLSLIMSALVSVAQYNNFINAPAIVTGWVAVRDVCNMFFVLILMIIAFATILKIESYNYKKLLPKLILMAILINFSKTICGLLIDFAQVVMLTFVNAFKDMAAANLVSALGISDILKLNADGANIGFWEVVGAYVLGLIYVIIAIVVVTTMLAMLVMRIVMIWVYVVLSPAAYLMSAFPEGKSYSSKWWDEFTKNLIVGPVLAFFIWLSFVSMQADISKDFPASGNQASTGAAVGQTVTNNTNSSAFAATKASTPEAFMKFVIAIGMLIGGLKISQEIGGAAGGMAGKGMGALQKGAKIGLGGVAAVTGYRYASGVMNSYRSQRKAKREEGYRVGAEKLAGGIGAAKKAITAPINDGAKWLRDKTVGRKGVEAQRLAKEATDAKEKAEIIRYDYRNKAYDGFKQETNKKGKKVWVKGTGNQRVEMSDKDMKEKVETDATVFDKQASEKEAGAQKARASQNRTDKNLKLGMITAGVLGTALTGGLAGFASGAFAFAAAGAALPSLGKSVKHAGDKDLAIASNWRLRQITETKDKMKADSNEDVLATMDDSSKSAFTRAAAAMEAMERDLVSVETAKNKKNEIMNTMGGGDEKGNFKDKKVGSYMDNIIEKHYPGASKLYNDYENGDDAQKAAAERKIKGRIEQGTYSMDLDTGTLSKSIDLLTNTMRNGEFVRQFKALKSQAKKDSIVNDLKKSTSNDSKEKLALVTDLNTAFGDGNYEAKTKALGNFSSEDLYDVFRKGTAEQQEAIKEVVKYVKSEAGSDPTVAKEAALDIFRNAKNDLDGSSPAAQDMKIKIGIMNKSDDKKRDVPPLVDQFNNPL